MRSLSRSVMATVLVVGSVAFWPASAGQGPAPPQGPAISAGGGRGPNPMPGLAGWVDSPTSGPDAPRFEVASIKRNKIGGGNPADTRTLPGGLVRTTNATLRMLIRMAYRLSLTDDIVGGPPWIDTAGFDVDARPSGPTTLADSALMLRTLLAERFDLVVRREAREMPIYALVVARRDGSLGSQIKRPAGECVMVVPLFARGAAGVDGNAPAPPKPAPALQPGQPGRRCGIGIDRDVVTAGSVTMATVVTLLTPLVGRPVIDRTGLTGAFDFDLRYAGSAIVPGRGRGAAVAPDTPIEPGMPPSIFTALAEQLGLRLEPGRGPVDVLAVAGADLPTEN